MEIKSKKRAAEKAKKKAAEEAKKKELIVKDLIVKDLKSKNEEIINIVNNKLDKAIKDYSSKDLNEEELNKYEKYLKKLVSDTISDNEILENESLIKKIVDKEVSEKNGECFYDSNSFNENDILKELVENTTFSPLYDDYSYITEKVDEKLYKYFDSPEYMNTFLMYLCNKENGKWIPGGAFGDSETSNGLVNNWGDTNCNSWVDASPSLCAGPNYKENCAKKCTVNKWGDANCNSWIDANPSLCANSNYLENCDKKCTEMAFQGINGAYFHKGPKCSFKTREQCDNSYNWHLMSGRGLYNVPPGLLYGEKKLEDFYNLFLNKLTKKMNGISNRNELFKFFDTNGKTYIDYFKKYQTLKNYNLSNKNTFENLRKK